MNEIKIIQHYRKDDCKFEGTNWLDVLVNNRPWALMKQYIPSDGVYYDELQGFLSAFRFMEIPYEIKWEQINDIDNLYPEGRCR
jgi:hypothetical protein